MAFPWDDLRLSQVEESASGCPDACAADVVSLVAEVRRLRGQVRIAEDALGQIVHDYDGCEVAACKIVPGVVADDALTRMSMVE